MSLSTSFKKNARVGKRFKATGFGVHTEIANGGISPAMVEARAALLTLIPVSAPSASPASKLHK